MDEKEDLCHQVQVTEDYGRVPTAPPPYCSNGNIHKRLSIEQKGCCCKKWRLYTCGIVSLVVGVLLFLYINPLSFDFCGEGARAEEEQFCSNACRFELVESIPENLTYPEGSPMYKSTFDAWNDLLDGAKHNVDMAVFYWSLKPEDVTPNATYPSSWQGEFIFDKIRDKGLSEDIRIRVVQNAPTSMQPQTNGKELSKLGAAEVTNIDIHSLLGGVLHTKLWIVDDDTFYIGSANMDFRSLTQVKELGVVVKSCPCLAQDMKKIFNAYLDVGTNNAIPQHWPDAYTTLYNVANPLTIDDINDSSVYLSNSPPPFNAEGRTNDVDAIKFAIRGARRTVDIAVMDYFPRTLYTNQTKFWPEIDDTLRQAALNRGVRVRLLISHWKHSRADLINWLSSLTALSSRYPPIDIQAKLFRVPAYTDEQKEIPFGRVNHNKYMVTDCVAYIGTSNWSADYFENTAGIGLVLNECMQPGLVHEDRSSLRSQLQALFDRDWNSEFASNLTAFE